MALINPASIRAWFCLAVGLGGLGIYVGSDWDSKIITVAFPIAVMVGYGVAAYFVDRPSISTSAFADSYYYLGFLLTLISLVVSLDLLGGKSGYDLDGIVNRFGVALITTILGLAVRVYLVNFQKGIDDSVKRSEAMLAQAAASLRERLEGVSRDMISQTTLMNQTLKSAVDTTGAELKTAVESATATLTDASLKIGSDLEALSEINNQAIQGATQELEKSVQMSTEAVTAASSSIEEDLRKLGAAVNGVSVAAVSVRDGIEHLGASMATAGDLSSSVDQLAVACQSVVQGVSEQGSRLATLRDQVTEDSDAIRDRRQRIEAELARAQKAYHELSRTLVEAATIVRDELKGTRR